MPDKVLLQCSGMITAHCSLDFPSSEMSFRRVAQAGLELLGSTTEDWAHPGALGEFGDPLYCPSEESCSEESFLGRGFLEISEVTKGLTILARLVLNSWAEAILLAWPPQVLGLQQPPSLLWGSCRRGRLGGAVTAVHLGGTSEDWNTSFPSRVSISFTTMALVELVRLKELEPVPEPKLEPRP
ncbi:hypothetical protein AAY473_026451 [Plecturocebus cupreus]